MKKETESTPQAAPDFAYMGGEWKNHAKWEAPNKSFPTCFANTGGRGKIDVAPILDQLDYEGAEEIVRALDYALTTIVEHGSATNKILGGRDLQMFRSLKMLRNGIAAGADVFHFED